MYEDDDDDADNGVGSGSLCSLITQESKQYFTHVYIADCIFVGIVWAYIFLWELLARWNWMLKLFRNKKKKNKHKGNTIIYTTEHKK